MTIRPNRILIHYGEIGLKGNNRVDFERQLSRNIRLRLKAEGLEWPVQLSHDRLDVEVPENTEADLPAALAILGEVAGIVSYAPAVSFPLERAADKVPDCLKRIEDTVVALAETDYLEGASFAVRVNRADKRFPVHSKDLERSLGGEIYTRTAWKKVNLTHPDRTFQVDMYPGGVFVYASKFKGVGGLPVLASGHALSLLSGGIDSPVAAYMMAKRGCRLDFFHMTASHVQQRHAADNPVAELACQISRYTLRSRLFLVPYTHFDLAVAGQETGYEMVLFRRFMARAAEKMAARIGALALVTGDALGQVASQTLENMDSASRAVAMPTLRPLIGFDKQEIIALARRIGTYELSIQPYKDCCALLNRHPKTKSNPVELARLEDRLIPNMAELIDATLADTITLEFECGRQKPPRQS